MRNVILSIALVFILIGTAIAGTIFRGPGTRLNVPCLSPMAASGSFGTADSAQVISYRDDGSSTTAVRSFTSITNMVATTGWFDSTKDAGGTNWWLNVYVDSLAGSTPTGKMVAVKVKIFTAGSWSETNFNVYVSSGQNNMMAAFDGTGGVALNLNQLKVVSTSDTAVSIVTSAASKPAMVIRSTNSSGGYGLYVSSKADAVYFDNTATSGNNYGLHVKTASDGGGAFFADGSSYRGAVLAGAAGTVIFGGETNSADFGANATYEGATINAFTNFVGTTVLRVDSTSNASWIKTTGTGALYADSTFNGRLVYIKYSTRTNPRIAGEVSRVVKYDSIGTNKSDVFYFYPPFSQAPAVGDSLLLYPLYSTSPTMVKDTIGTITASTTSLPDSVQSNIARHVWDRTADTTYPNKSWGDTVGKTALNVVTYLKPIYDTVQLYDNWLRDSIHNAAIYARIAADSIQVYDNAGRFQAIVQQILDTIQTYDNATRFQANVQELLDTLKTYDNAGRFQALVQEILDTLKLHDNWVAKEASVTKVRDSVSKLHFSGDSVVAIDPIRTVAATVSGGATEVTAQKAVDSIHAVHLKVEAVRDTAHIIDSIVKAMSPILTQARDSINALSTWLDPTLDSLLYASGFKQGARSIQGVSNDCDTLHVKIGTTEWFKMLFYHVGGTPGARPDSTITVAP